MPNDETAAPVITYLQQQGVQAENLPGTGQDATLVGLQKHHQQLPVRNGL